MRAFVQSFLDNPERRPIAGVTAVNLYLAATHPDQQLNYGAITVPILLEMASWRSTPLRSGGFKLATTAALGLLFNAYRTSYSDSTNETLSWLTGSFAIAGLLTAAETASSHFENHQEPTLEQAATPAVKTINGRMTNVNIALASVLIAAAYGRPDLLTAVLPSLVIIALKIGTSHFFHDEARESISSSMGIASTFIGITLMHEGLAAAAESSAAAPLHIIMATTAIITGVIEKFEASRFEAPRLSAQQDIYISLH